MHGYATWITFCLDKHMYTEMARTTDTYKQITENLTTAVLLLNRKLQLEYINPAGEMLFAISARRLRGMDINELFNNAHQLIESFHQAMRSGHGFTERELQITLSSARTTTTVDCIVTPIGDPKPNYEILVELLQVDRHLRITREENLVAQHNVTRALIRGKAHEIKNPLGGLRGAAQLLERELKNESQKEYTQVIIGEADRLQSLVDRMLGPNVLPHMRNINIHQVMERVYSLAKVEATKNVRIVRDYDPSIPDLRADPDQLIQAVLNIVRNAMQAVGNKGKITLRTRTMRQFTIGQIRHKLIIRIDIIDNGPGVPPEMMESIFYPMVTGRAEGTGLGLSIAQSLVNQHGGLIECSSEPGNTQFTLLLPLGKNSRVTNE